MLVPVSDNQNKSKEDSRFYENKKVQIAFSVYFAGSCHRGSTHLLPRQLHSAFQHQAAAALSCVCEHLRFISIYCVYPLAKHVLRLLLRFMPFCLVKNVIGTLCFWILRGRPHCFPEQVGGVQLVGPRPGLTGSCREAPAAGPVLWDTLLPLSCKS